MLVRTRSKAVAEQGDGSDGKVLRILMEKVLRILVEKVLLDLEVEILRILL